ncbi:hypothetical protein KUTeg_010060 [Tegillarca granosa]|uniref:Telomerase-binding protein EST1A n=1 Tax=Tegillarca granosa TaxID=220873 RepID=A0ABQ9FA21_TEGGR|nr:hypothetical protein KUTeg_010060 [Tegillarca granosa]
MRKMAAKTENGRNISQEIDDKVQTKNQNTSISSSDDKRRKQKRPTRGIYTPPSILRQKQLEHDDVKSREAIPETENWADEIECHSSTSDSKENSVERELEVDNTRTGFKNLNITEKGQSADRHRSKRPALQIYVPKGKLLEQQTKGSEEEREIEELETDGKSQEFRKVDVKQDQKHLQVTVVNEQSSPKSKSASESLTYQKKGGNPRDANNKERIEDTKQDHKQKHNQQDARGFRAGSHDKFAKGDSGQQYNKDKRSGYTTQGDNRQRNNPNTKHDSGFRKNEPQGQGNRGFNRHSGHGSHRGNQEYIHGPGGAKSGNCSDVKKSPAAVEKVKSPETREAAPEEDEDIDSNIIQTMVFERKGSSSSAVESSDIQNLKQKPPSGQQGGGKPGSKRYSLSAMRRPRAGSVSSDVSTASDLSIDEETTTRILDWDAEVEREMAKQVQDETLKLKEFLERQGDFDDWDRASNTESPFEKYYEYGSKTQDKPDSKDTMDKQYDRSDYERNKERNLNNGLRNKNSNASYSGFQSRKSTSRERLLDDDYNRNFDDRYYEEGPRSRRKDRRRGDSANGRRSRDSSVSSVHSVRSCHDDEMYGGSSTLPRRRRRRRRSSGGSSLRQSSSHDRLNEPDALNLKVTFAQNDQRQVSLQESDRRGRGRGRGQKRHEQGQQRHEQDHGGRGHFYQSHGSQREKLRSSSEQDIRGTGKYLDEQHKHGESRTLDRKYENRRRNMQEQERLYDSFDDHGRGHDRDRGQGQGRGQGRGRRGRGRGQENTRYQRGSQSELSPTKEPSSSPKGGGVIILPSNTTTSSENMSSYPHAVKRDHDFKHRGIKHDTQGKHFDHHGNVSGQRKLFDPKNPNKPIMIPNQSGNLQFQDGSPTSEKLNFQDSSPSPNARFHEGNQGPRFPQPMPPFPPGYGQFYPGYDGSYPPPMMPPFPGYYFPGYPPQFPRDNAAIPGYPEEGYNRDPYFQSMDPAEQALTRSKTQNKMMAERTFQEALPLDKQLGQLISCRMTGEGIHMMSQLRHQLQHKYERIILLDADISNRHNVEQLLWKSVFYQVIEVFRKHVADEKDEETKSQLTQILEEGTAFYNDLLQKLQQTFSFNLEDFIDENKLPPENLGRTVKLALLSAQRTMICLGDIARYKEQTNDTGKVNYGRARSWYSKAQQIAPKNGRPYNQLAILALYTRRKLDAVYYYMRSLAASNPFLTARESLMSLFDEARKKAEAAEKKRDEERMKLSKHKKHRQQHGHRVEIWVSPDGSSQEDQDDGFDPDDLTKLDAIELNKRFVLSFLNVHGKLFTKIGRENFMECCAQMLKEFQALLKDGAIGPTRLLQLMAINMFAIENTALKEESLDDAVRSELQELAVQLGLDMFGILVERCSVFLTEHLQSRDYPSHMFSRDLEELIPGVKIWTDWMTCNSTLWNPPPCLRDITLGPNIDVWKVTAEFCNVLKDLDVSHVKLYQDRREGCDPVVLPEDTMLAGFVPLLSALMESSFVHSTVEKEIAKDCLRIQKLQLFGEYLCGIEPPMLAFNVETKRYYSVAPSIEEEEIKEENYMEEPLSDEDVIIESEEEVLAEGEDGDDEHVRQLKTKKEELKKKKEEQEKLAENKQMLQSDCIGM